MAGEDGINVVLKVGINILGGQQSTTLNLATAMADTTNKDDAGWQGSLPTTRSGDISVNGILDTTDTAYEALRAAWLAGTNIACTLVLNAAGAEWAGNFFVEAMPGAGDIASASTYDFTLKSDGALTYTP